MYISMNFSDKALFFFSCLGVFNGLILSLYLFFLKTKKHLSGHLLAAILLMISIRVGKSAAYFFDYNLPKNYLQIGLTACFFIGPLVYMFTKAEMMQIRKMPRSWVIQLFFWFLVILLIGLIYPYQYHPQFWGKYTIPLIYLQWGVFMGFTIFLISSLAGKIVKGESIKSSEKLVLAICGAVTILFLFYVWAILNITRGSYIFGALWFSVIIYLIILFLINRKKTNDLFSGANNKSADRKTDLKEVEQIIERLQKVMTDKSLFKNPDLKINDVAREINISGHYLSRILNENIEKNFTLFVNEYRINEACTMLSQTTNITIEAIGDEVGFNSKSTFFATFKKIKGTTPSVYQQSVTPDL